MLAKTVGFILCMLLALVVGLAFFQKDKPVHFSTNNTSINVIPVSKSAPEEMKMPILPSAAQGTPATALGKRDKEEILSAVVSVVQGVGGLSQENALGILGSYGDQALVVMLDEIKKGYSDTPTQDEAKKRIAWIDALGIASHTKPFVLKALEDFLSAPSQETRSNALKHMSLVDKEEVFEYLAKEDEAFAVQYVKHLQNKTLAYRFIKHFVIGLKMRGMEEEDAISKAYDLFGKESA